MNADNKKQKIIDEYIYSLRELFRTMDKLIFVQVGTHIFHDSTLFALGTPKGDVIHAEYYAHQSLSIKKIREESRYSPYNAGFYYSMIEEKRKAVIKELREVEQRQAKFAAYWAAHAKEKANLENEQKILEEKIGAISKQIKVIEVNNAPKLKELESEKKKKTPCESEAEKQNALIRDLENQRDNCGIFKGKVKKAIQERINSQEKPKLEQLKKQADAERKSKNDTINAEINELNGESSPLHKEVSKLRKRLDEVIFELTKDR